MGRQAGPAVWSERGIVQAQPFRNSFQFRLIRVIERAHPRHHIAVANVKLISSRDNSFFKQLVKLAESAQQRRASALTLLDGIHLIRAYRLALGQPQNLIMSESGCQNEEIKQLLAEEREKAVENETPVTVLSDALFRAISPVKTPTGVIALIAIPEATSIPERNERPLFCAARSYTGPGKPRFDTAFRRCCRRKQYLSFGGLRRRLVARRCCVPRWARTS